MPTDDQTTIALTSDESGLAYWIGESFFDLVLFLILSLLMAGMFILPFYALAHGYHVRERSEGSNITDLYYGTIGLLSDDKSDLQTVDDLDLISSDQAPSEMVYGDTLVNPWGDPITVNGSVDETTIEDDGVPKAFCARELGTTKEFTSVNINNAMVSAPVSTTTALKACNLSKNTLTFTFDTFMIQDQSNA